MNNERSERELTVLRMLKELVEAADKDKQFAISVPYGEVMLMYHQQTGNSYVIRIEEL